MRQAPRLPLRGPLVPGAASPHARYLHGEAAALKAEAPGGRRDALHDHLDLLRVGVMDAQQPRAGGADAQAAEAEVGRPGEVAEHQHGGGLLILDPAPPARARRGAQLPGGHARAPQ